jgi:hypothetical protein
MLFKIINWRIHEIKQSWPNLRYSASFFLVELRKTMKDRQASNSADWVLSLVLPNTKQEF